MGTSIKVVELNYFIGPNLSFATVYLNSSDITQTITLQETNLNKNM
jgi:hypothetical protein